MKAKLKLILLSLTLIITLTLTSCLCNKYDGECRKIKSPTGSFKVSATVNSTDKKADNYADVIVHIFDKNNKRITQFNSGAGDFSKWTIGWSESEDIIILQSSDIGNRAWIIKDNIPTRIPITKKMNERAEYLKSKRYK